VFQTIRLDVRPSLSFPNTCVPKVSQPKFGMQFYLSEDHSDIIDYCLKKQENFNNIFTFFTKRRG
jgi:hypothetical protein